MSYNPFYIEPGNDMTQGLAGIGDVVRDLGEQRKHEQALEEQAQAQRAEEAAIQKALTPRPDGTYDLKLVNETGAKYDRARKFMFDAMNAENGESQKRTLGRYRELAALNANSPPEKVLERWDQLNEEGRLAGHPMEDSVREREFYAQNPEEGRKLLPVFYATLEDPKAFEAFEKANAEPEYEPILDSKGNIIGQMNKKTRKAESDPRSIAIDNSLQEVYDPNSPTGSKFVPRSEAIGQPGKMPSKMEASFNPQTGEFNISQGATGLTNSQKSAVQGKILTAGDTMAQVQAIKSRYKPEYQQIGSRAGVAWSAMKDKINPESLSAEEKTMLEDFTAYRAEAVQLFSLTLKDLSGAAVTPIEMERAKNWLPNPGTGLFDGDSPSQLQSKIQRFEDFTRKALMKYIYINRFGLTKDDVDVEEMPKLMNERGNVIAQELEAQGLKGGDLKSAVKLRLSDEFGLGLY